MFNPRFTISSVLANKLVRIENLASELRHASITPTILAGLRETARIQTVHYSTQIEGNLLTLAEVRTVLDEDASPVGRERDEAEVRGYFTALNQVAEWTDADFPISEERLKRLHALVMAGGRQTSKRTPYRQEQNRVQEAGSGRIIYMPPEPQDVPGLMTDLIDWLNSDDAAELPGPVTAGLLHYQFVTIHPYIDGNGRTARLLASWQMHRVGYGLGGIYSLEEHYARNLSAYYASMALGPSHNYYFGREDADLTPWIEYFVDGVLKSFFAVADHTRKATEADEATVKPAIYLDRRKRELLAHCKGSVLIKSTDLANLFGLGDRAARNLAAKWVEEGFLEIENPSKKARLYRITYNT